MKIQRFLPISRGASIWYLHLPFDERQSTGRALCVVAFVLTAGLGTLSSAVARDL